MNTIRLTQARRIFASYDCPRDTRRSYMRQWARSLRALGDKALLNARVQKIGGAA